MWEDKQGMGTHIICHLFLQGILPQHNLEENEMKEGWKINKTRIWFLILKNVLQ
jgi:hypothetical protein